MVKNYKKTLTACYLGFITQAIAANFTPLLFLKFHNDYNIPLKKIALISTAFFLTQLIVDVLCAHFADRIGYRKCVVASELCSAAGLIGLAFLPELFSDPFTGIIISVIIYAIGSGLIEVLCSPIVEACPFEHKEAVMSLLHSFYCWGSVGVILISTLFFAVFGIGSWKWLACLWAIIPIYNIYNFAKCPIEHLTEDGKGMKINRLFRIPLFWLAIILMICSGASELSMSQWASAYVESALGLSKSTGDLAGPCMFAVTMGISRMIYGKYGSKLNLIKFMWPGTISICSERISTGGTAMFALLAMAGDLGGAFGPGLVGNIAQNANNNLQKGMLAGCIFPLVLIISLLILKNLRKDKI